jgi:hypothetical protein
MRRTRRPFDRNGSRLTSLPPLAGLAEKTTTSLFSLSCESGAPLLAAIRPVNVGHVLLHTAPYGHWCSVENPAKTNRFQRCPGDQIMLLRPRAICRDAQKRTASRAINGQRRATVLIRRKSERGLLDVHASVKIGSPCYLVGGQSGNANQ